MIKPGSIITATIFIPSTGVKILSIAEMLDESSKGLFRQTARAAGLQVTGVFIKGVTTDLTTPRDAIRYGMVRDAAAMKGYALEGEDVFIPTADLENLYVGGVLNNSSNVPITINTVYKEH